MTKIVPTAAEVPKTVAKHNGLWTLLGGGAFILFAVGVLMTLRWLGLK
jgi:hypothetical protein